MSVALYETILLGLVGTLFFMLIGVLVWIGNRVHSKLDDLTLTVGNGLGVTGQDNLASIFCNLMIWEE